MPQLSQVYTSIHLAEAGLTTEVRDQGAFGECWAFTTVALLENAILLDKAKISNTFWQQQVPGLHLSEAFVVMNVRGVNSALGGFFWAAANYAAEDAGFVTVEVEANYPYEGLATYLKGYNESILTPKISASNYYKPFQTLQYQNYSTAAVAVVYQQNSKFSTSDIQRIKSWLSRGFALSLQMFSSAGVFSNYDGTSWVAYPCNNQNVDHTVTLVGYGTYHGREVWVVKNSWGVEWGAKGYFYTPIGDDNFCMEHSAYAILPPQYNAADGAYSNIGSQARAGTMLLDADYSQLENNTGSVDPMKIVRYTVQQNGQNFSGSITVEVRDSSQTLIYSGSQQSFQTNARKSRFPISISITPQAPYYAAQFTGIVDATNIVVQLSSTNQNYILNALNLTITQNSTQFTGQLTVQVFDQYNTLIHQIYEAQFVSPISDALFPLKIKVIPPAAYQEVTYQVASQSKVDLLIQLQKVSSQQNLGLIIGCSIGGSVTICAVFVVLFCYLKSRKRNQTTTQDKVEQIDTVVLVERREGNGVL